MAHPGSLAKHDEALALIKSTEDPVVRNLLDMAFMEFVRDRFGVGGGAYSLESDFDMLYCMNILKSFFANREPLELAIRGGEPEAWFDEAALAERAPTLAP